MCELLHEVKSKVENDRIIKKDIVLRRRNMKQRFKLTLVRSMANLLAVCAMTITVALANQCCVFVYHQPKVPEGFKKLRKF